MSVHLGDDALLSSRGVLLVTAHPDDEAMFFVPTLLALQARGVAVHVLCLSTGDYDGLGAARSEELVRSCASLGVPAERVALVDDARLRDGPDERWEPALVASLVRRELRRRALAAVVTFDAYGVSGHPNHAAVHRGVRALAAAGGAPSAYELVSTGFVRKHSGLVDVVVSAAAARLLGRCCFLSAEPWRCHAAMRCHATQYVWFRRLYVLTSRYVFCNTLRPLGESERVADGASDSKVT